VRLRIDADCKSELWNLRRPVPSLVVASGKTATMSPGRALRPCGD
jgi:hypothetical protein